MRYKATSELIQEAVHAWLCSAPLPNHIRVFDVTDLYETGGLWGFTYQGKHYKLRPLKRATEIAVSLPRPDLCGRGSRGQCIVNALGCTKIRPMCNITADIYVAAYFPEAADEDFSFALIAFDWVRQCWDLVRWAVSVRPWILHWLEEAAKSAEMRRIIAANQGRLGPDAILQKGAFIAKAFAPRM